MTDLTIYRATTRIERAKNILHALSGKSIKTKILLGTFLTSSTILGSVLGPALGIGTASEIAITIGGVTVVIVGSTLVGIAAARDGQMKRGAIEGALIGLGITGCTIASTGLLQGSTVSSLTASFLLGAGGAGGALLVTAAGMATKSGEKAVISAILINITGGSLLTGAGETSLLGEDASLLVLSIAMFTAEMLAGYISSLSQKALYIDNALSRHIQYSHLHSKEAQFKHLLENKSFYAPINLSDERISYSELLHKVIKHKAPSTWFEMLLQQPEIDLNFKNTQDQTPMQHIIEKLQNYLEETIYWEYLKCLLENSRIELFNSDGNRDTLYKLCKILDTKLSKQERNTEIDDILLKLLASYCTSDDISQMPENLECFITPYLPPATKSANTAQNYNATASAFSELSEGPRLTTFGDLNWTSELYILEDRQSQYETHYA